MKVLTKIADVGNYIEILKQKSLSIGFVPTMGALHQGHLSLIEKSSHENDITLCSIFINPIQFNNKEDFDKYPVQSDRDIEMLEKAGCNMVFIPSVDEMYPEPITEVNDFGLLDNFMEGAFRKGHFNGVGIVVKRLFEITEPDKAYFGEKDFQQLQILRHLVKTNNLPVEIVSCPIIRETDGLAMSSRNVRLTSEERKIAPQIYRALNMCSELGSTRTVQQVKSIFLNEISAFPEFQIDYFEIADEATLQPITNWSESKNPRAFVAIFLGNVRLIDNIKIIL
jgi:pantoate--beta-alanine ligase